MGLLRTGATLTAGTLMLALLTSCSMPAIGWFRVHNGSLAGFAACNESARVDAIRVVVETAQGDALSWQSYGGPAILVDPETELDFEHLPPGWQSLGATKLDAAGNEPYLYVEAFDSGEMVFNRSVRASQGSEGQWFANGDGQRCSHKRGTSPPVLSPLVIGLTGSAAARESVGLKPMDPQEFWSLMVLVNDGSAPTRVQIRERLAELSLQDLKAFYARLLLEVFDLDTFVVWSEVQAQWDGYSAADPDDFLAARLDLIEAGESVVEEAKTGVIPEGVLSQTEDRWLMQVAQAVARSRGETLGQFSYRLPTGVALNQSGWTAPAP